LLRIIYLARDDAAARCRLIAFYLRQFYFGIASLMISVDADYAMPRLIYALHAAYRTDDAITPPRAP
jgi:hypothetical protein